MKCFHAIRFRAWAPVLAAAVFLTAGGTCAASEGSAQRPAEEVVQRQDKPRVHPRVLERADADNVSIYVSLDKQRAYLRVGDEVAVDTPVSTGKRAGMTPRGEFEVMEKLPEHQSRLYGDYVDAQGRVVRGGVSAKIDSGPSGTVFRSTPMKYFMRLDWSGVGLHAGRLPGYPAAHGSVRLPEEIARIFYENVRPGTKVIIGD